MRNHARASAGSEGEYLVFAWFRLVERAIFRRQLDGWLWRQLAWIIRFCDYSSPPVHRWPGSCARRAAPASWSARPVLVPAAVPLRAQSSVLSSHQRIPEVSAWPLACSSKRAAARVLSGLIHLLAFNCTQRLSAQGGIWWTARLLPVQPFLWRTGCIWLLVHSSSGRSLWASNPSVAACG